MHNPLCSGASLKHAQAMGAMITSVARAMDCQATWYPYNSTNKFIHLGATAKEKETTRLLNEKAQPPHII